MDELVTSLLDRGLYSTRGSLHGEVQAAGCGRVETELICYSNQLEKSAKISREKTPKNKNKETSRQKSVTGEYCSIASISVVTP